MKYKNYILQESYQNLFLNDKDKRLKYVDQVWEIIKLSYKKAEGGKILTNGFQSKEKLIQYIPFWKLAVKDGVVLAAIFYKDKGGRKSVAAATNGTPEGKNKLAEMLKADFERSFGEKSHAVLGFVKKLYPDLVKKYAIPAKDVANIIGAEPGEIELIKGEEFEYIHNFGGKKIRKMMLGTPGKSINPK